MRLRALVPALLAIGGLAAADADLFKPDVRYSTFSFPGLRVHAPADAAGRLAPVAARAAAIYARMQADAGYASGRTLHLVLSDDEDGHNGFSTVVPFPLVNVQLGPTRPESGLFAGDDETVRTLVHELGHHLANDRSQGWRGALESVFGRVVPSDPLSLGVFLLSTPDHVLAPAFWHEGIAQWAETAYADPAQAWGGRGRDSLSHMAWRLDAAAGGVAPEDTWRLDWQTWPYGNRAYLYGLAYVRWLSASFGDRRGLWSLVGAQARLNAPFAFAGGAIAAVGHGHDELIPLARADLQAEQDRVLAHIRSLPVTTVPRQTPRRWRVAAPAWSSRGALLFAADPADGSPRLASLDAEAGTTALLGTASWSMGNLRRLADGLAVQSDAAVGGDRWRRSRARLLRGATTSELPGERLIMPDARADGDGWQLVAVRLDGAAAQSLLLRHADGTEVALAVQGRPWSPALRPGRDELCWVETDAAGSRLVLAAAAGGHRRVLWQVRGRILHPVWDAQGARIFCASDVSGVANAWCIDPDGGDPRPVTNVIGGVLAAVPSPDGTRLALLDHDADGPYIGIIALDPASWPAQLPQVVLPWPAPVARRPLGVQAAGGDRPDPAGPLPRDDGIAPQAVPYSGLAELRPRFWTPTTAAVPEGGLGVVAVATDALLTHTVIASVGAGYHERAPVGLAAWTYSGWNPDLAIIAKRSELGYDEQILAADGRLYDYVETVDTVEGRIGYGLAGFERRWHGWLAAGVESRQAVDSASDDYAGLATADPQPWQGSERYLELTAAYDDSILFPTSYAREDGLALAANLRIGDERGSSALGQASYSLPVWAEGGHQLVGAMQLGWSDGPHDLQSRFGVGGNRAQGVPRGYPKVLQRGRCLEAYSLAYRLPLWRAFDGVGTTPWVSRQVVLEAFYDVGGVGDRLGEATWYRSAGAELHLEFAFWTVRFAPGVGIARQIDADEDTAGYLSLGFRW